MYGYVADGGSESTVTSKTQEETQRDMPGRHLGYTDPDGRYLVGYQPQDYRRDYGGYYEGEEPRREYRSRTPGPEFMRGQASPEDEHLRSRIQLRSKTPTHELAYQSPQPPQQHSPHQHSPHQHLSGTPDFIPASRYAFPSSPSQTHDTGYRPAGSDFPHTYSNGRLNNSHNSHSGSSSSNSYGNSRNQYGDRGHPLAHLPVSPVEERARKQSTSFENEVPAPSNLTRVPRNERWSESPHGMNRSRSPTSMEDHSGEILVHLKRQESGFGFRIVGGTEEGSQVSLINTCIYGTE